MDTAVVPLLATLSDRIAECASVIWRIFFQPSRYRNCPAMCGWNSPSDVMILLFSVWLIAMFL